MMFNEVEPYENLDLKCFRSEPAGRWEAGVLKMGFGKARVRIALALWQSAGYVPIDYWGGDHQSAYLLLGFLLAILTSLPESIEERELVRVFPEQDDKELGPDFWRKLFLASAQVRATYGDYQP
jgi:hypothetical protein